MVVSGRAARAAHSCYKGRIVALLKRRTANQDSLC